MGGREGAKSLKVMEGARSSVGYSVCLLSLPARKINELLRADPAPTVGTFEWCLINALTGHVESW